MEYKNRSFKIFDTTWKIVFQDKLNFPEMTENSFLYGRTCADLHTVWIALKDSNGKEFSENDIKITLVHELVHAILDEGQYCTESCNEALVEWLAKCITSLIKQKVL